MDHLPFPPTPPTPAVLALPEGAPAIPMPHSSAPPPDSWWRCGFRIVGNLVLLPLRLGWRIAVDIAATLEYGWHVVLETVSSAILIGCVATMIVIDAFGENFFLGEILMQVFPDMAGYVPDNAVGAMLAAVFPALDELRGAAAFAFVVAGVAVSATTLFFAGLLAVLDARAEAQVTPEQERLLLDPHGQEHPLATRVRSHASPWARVRLVTGAVVSCVILTFEASALFAIYGWLGLLGALLLLATRVAVGFLTHHLTRPIASHIAALLQALHGFVFTLVNLVRNLLEELMMRLQTLASR